MAMTEIEYHNMMRNLQEIQEQFENVNVNFEIADKKFEALFKRIEKIEKSLDLKLEFENDLYIRKTKK